MDQAVRIILEFVDQASAPIQGAAGAIGGALGRLGSGATTTVGIIGKGFSGLVGVVGGAIGGVTNFITGLVNHMKWASLFVGSAIVGFGIKTLELAANVEQARVAFDNLLGSSKQGGELMAWLTKFYLQTPVTRQQLEDSARTFLAYGNNLEQTKTAVLAVTEATSALGVNQTRLNAITYNLGQITESTTVSYREFRQLQLQGINTAKLLAQAVDDGQLKLAGFGATAGGAEGPTKKMTAAFKSATDHNRYLGDQIKITKERLDTATHAKKVHQATVDSLNLTLRKEQDQLAKNNSAINTYHTATTQAGKAVSVAATNLTELTREQQMSIIKMNSGTEIAHALELQLIKTYGGSSLKQVKTLSGMISNFGDIFQYVVQRALGISLEGDVKIGGAFDHIRNAAANLMNFLLTHVDAIANFFNKILTNMTAVYAVAGFLFGIFIGFFGGIIAPVMLAGAIFGLLGIAVGKVAEHFGGMNNILQAGIGIWNVITGFINGTVIPVFRFLWNDLAIFLMPAIQMMQPSLKQLGDAFIKLGPPLLFIIGVLAALAGAIITGLVTAFVSALPWIIGALTNLVTVITGILNIIKGIFTLNFGLIWEGVKQVFGGILEFIANTLTAILAAVTGFVLGVISFFEMLFDKLIGKSIIPDIVNGILNWFNILMTKGLDVIGSLVSGIASKFTGLVSSAFDWGKDMVNNFINGIKSMAAEARNIANKGGIVGKLMKDAGFQHGGIVPGMLGQAVPIIAHGGERIIPTSGIDVNNRGGGGGVTINMNGNITLDSEERIRQLADRIFSILNRQSELAKYGLR